jgi:coenzyme PQQ precursor peptide PqqA
MTRVPPGTLYPSAHEEVSSVENQMMWETPQFEEIGVAPEVTMYVATMDD